MKRTLAAALAACTLAIGGCGIPRDSHPHEISDRSVQALVAPSTTTPTTTQSVGAPEVAVYFLRDDSLQEVRVSVQDKPTLNLALGFLLAGPTPAQLANGLTSSIPPGTKLRKSMVSDDGTATIDLSSEMNTVGGRSAKAAYAELVFTALGTDGINRVRFQVEDQSIDAPTDDGSVNTVTTSNYKPPLNPD